MFKKIMQYGTIALTLFSLAGLTSCGDNTERMDTEYFKCEINNKKGYAIIRELTEIGMEQEILDIPMYLNGLPVTQIGADRGIVGGGITIRSTHLKKLYIPHTVNTIPSEVKIPENSEVVVNQFDISEDYIYKLYEIDIIHPYYFEIDRDPKKPNVTFFYNYEGALNNGYYCFDYVSESSLYLLPQSPVRKNYEFVDWYLEDELITPWDKKMPESIDEVLNLYAKWNKE